jgi:peroxiredoxin
VIGIFAASVHDVTRFAPRFHMRYAIAADPDETVSKAFDASAVPLVVIVDATGIVRAVTLGYSSVRMKHMKQLVGQLVSQQ